MWLLIPLIALVLVLVLIVGVVMAVVATAALVIGLVLHAVPFLLIAVALWWLAKAMFGAGRARPHRDQTRSVPRARAAQRSTSRPTVQQRPAGSRQPASRPRELPIDVQVKVEQIRSKADVLLTYA